MIKILLCLVYLSSIGTDSVIYSNTETTKVKVIVSGIKEPSGEVRLGVYDKEDGFLEIDAVISSSILKVDGNTVVTEFELDATKEYAVAVYHDKNLNKKFDFNILGLPKEKYGFSNNPNIWFRKPTFKECKFEISSDKTIEIKI